MSEFQWLQFWQDAQANPYDHAAVSLLLLNGLQVEQIRNLHLATIDLEGHWLTTHDHCTYPLVTYTVEALKQLYLEATTLASDELARVCEILEPIERDAHRRLAGAVWITDEDLQLALETAGIQETPILPLRFTFPFSIVERLQPNEVSEVADRSKIVLQAAADWLYQQTLTANVSFIKRVFGLVVRQGSVIFLFASTGVSGLNLIHNVLMGRLLTPADYSQLTFIITLQLLVGLFPSVLQTVTARFSARYVVQKDQDTLGSLVRSVGRFGWWVGLLITAVLLLVSPLLIRFFQIDNIGLLLPVLFVMPFFIRMGTYRGLLQGVGSYFWLSAIYLSEGVVRLGIGVILGYGLFLAGRSLEGAIWGVAESMLVSWFISFLAIRHFSAVRQTKETPTQDAPTEWRKLGIMTLYVLIGQALITNSDFVLVKNYFAPSDAGLYAAISVLGRIVYFGALPLTILLVPLIARRQALDEPTRPILMLLIGGGGVVCGGLIAVSALFPQTILGVLYGNQYVAASNLLAPYALAASLYTLTNLVVTYQIALGSGGETWMPLLAGVGQIVGIVLFHGDLQQVILVQIVIMAILFAVVLWRVLRPVGAPSLSELSPQVVG